MEVPSLGKGECHRLLGECVRLALPSFVNGNWTGSFNALSALRKIVQWPNQGLFEESVNEAPIAFVVLAEPEAMLE